MGKKIFYCGRNGNGAIVKIINNCFAAVQAISTCEGLAMGVRAGVDFKVMCDIIGEGTGATNFLKTYGPMKAFRGDYEPGFATELMFEGHWPCRQPCQRERRALCHGRPRL